MSSLLLLLMLGNYEGVASTPNPNNNATTESKVPSYNESKASEIKGWMEKGNASYQAAEPENDADKKQALYQKAFSYYQHAASYGHISAHLRLGMMYYKGMGISQSYPNALKLFQKAANQGSCLGAYRVGFMYERGEGVQKSYKKAVFWYHKAAREIKDAGVNLKKIYDNGYVGLQPQVYKEDTDYIIDAASRGEFWAQIMLSAMYEEGKGVKQSNEEAKRWYEEGISEALKLAENKNVGAQFEISKYYEKDSNYKESLFWIREAAKNGHREAQLKLGCLYGNSGKIVNRDPSTSHRIAQNFSNKIRSNGEQYGGIPLLYCFKHGIPQSYLETIKACIKNYLQNSKDFITHMLELDALADYQLTINQPLEESLKWYEKSIRERFYTEFEHTLLTIRQSFKQPNIINERITQLDKKATIGDPKSKFLLGGMYYTGYPRYQQSYKKAFEFFKEAAEANHNEAFFHLAGMYINGCGPEQSYKAAAEWLHQAACNGHIQSQFVFGLMNFWGLGIKQSYKEAAEWYLKITPFKYAEAQFNLYWCYKHGLGVFKNKRKAKEWLEKSIKPLEIYDPLYEFYKRYYETLQDVVNDFDIFKIAGLANNEFSKLIIMHSQASYSSIYSLLDTIRNDQKDYDLIKTKKNYLEAALKGNSDAQLKLAIIYACGLSSNICDTKIAIEWLCEAAQRRQFQSKEILEKTYKTSFANDQDNKREELINLWKQGNDEALAELGRLYADISIERSPSTIDEDVFEWLSAASQRGNVKALYRLGRMHEYGWGTPKDEKAAFECFKKGASAYWHAPAQKALAEMYREGRGGVEPSHYLAAKWYSRVGKQGDAGASAAIKEIADENFAPALYALGRAHEEGWGIARDEDEAMVQYEVSALQGYFKGQYTIAVKQLEGKASLKEELEPLEVLTLLSGTEARKTYLSWIGRKFDRKEKKKLKELQEQGLPEPGYYKAQHKLAELYASGQVEGVSFGTVEAKIKAYQETIRLYEEAGKAITHHKLVTLEPLEKTRLALAHLQQLGDQETFDLDYPGFKEFLQEWGPSDPKEEKKLEADFVHQLAFIFKISQSFEKDIHFEVKKILQKLLGLPMGSKAAWGGLTMLKTLTPSQQKNFSNHNNTFDLKKELSSLAQKIDLLDPSWCYLPSPNEVASQKMKVSSLMLYDPRVEIFNSCFWEFEKESYEDTFEASVSKIITIFDKLHLQKLGGEGGLDQDLSSIHEGLQRLLTNGSHPNHRYKRRTVKIADIIQEKFEEGKVKRDLDSLASLKTTFLIWAERGQKSDGDCPAGWEDALSQFYLNYIIDSKGGSATALSKEDWSLEMQVAVSLSQFRHQLLDEIVVEEDDDRIHAVKHLEKKARIALGLLGDAENYVDGLEKTSVKPEYLLMMTQDIQDVVEKKYTPETMASYIIKQVSSSQRERKEDDPSKSIYHGIFYSKLLRRLQFQYIREKVAPGGDLDHSLFCNEDYLLDKCTREDFERHMTLRHTFAQKDPEKEKLQDWDTLKGQAYMKARETIEKDYYGEDSGLLSIKGAKSLLKGMRYLEEE